MKGLLEPAPLCVPTITDYLARRPGPTRRQGGGGAPDRAPLFSVVTVVFNGERHLEDAIRSVVRQSETDREYIVIDGGSTDRSLEIIQDHEHHIDLWISEPDRGMWDAINKGLALCRGRYTKLLNADDLLPVHALASARDAFSHHGDRVCVRSDLEVIDDAGRVIERMGTARMIRHYPVFLHPSWCLPRSIYEELGLYVTKYTHSADSEYAMRLSHNGIEAVHLDEVLAQFRVGGMSQSTTGVWEGFDIHRRYIGEARAAHIMGTMLWKKLRFHALATLVGERRAHSIRARLKSWMGVSSKASFSVKER